MYSKNNDFETLINARLSSTDWGIWGKEKYKYSEKQQKEKHEHEIALLNKIMVGIPERMKIALRFSFAICDLNAYSSPISEKEFDYLSGIYKDALEYTSQIPDEGFRELIQEMYYINKTASEIPEFTKGQLVNETMQPHIWRKYIYLDFFKFSCINKLMRDPIRNVVKYSDEVLTSKFILSYFLGTGSFVEKVSILFSNESYQQIKEYTKKICKKIELFPEFPDIQYKNYYKDYEELLKYVKVNRKNATPEMILDFLNRRYNAFNICNQYYTTYYELKHTDSQKSLLNHKNPLKSLTKLYNTVSKASAINTYDVLLSLRAIRAVVDEKYYDASSIPDEIPIKNYLINTTNPFFQALLYEGKILSILYQADHPEDGKNLGILFTELVPFYAYQYKKKGQLFTLNTELPANLPRLVLTHHIHNANCEKLYDKMVINKLLIWDSEKIFFNISSSSSKVEVVLKERENCLTLGYNYYRIHARQHLKAGNQNRAVFNAIDGIGKEYYFTLDDDYFAVPNFALAAHKEIDADNLDYFQAPLAFRGMYDNTTVGEQTDAEVMHYFECTYGYNYPRILTFPRGTGTIFNFTDGKSSIADTGGFLVDFSCEDFGQGYLSLIQHNSTIFGKNKSGKAPGEISKNVYVIGEGIDLNGKIRQIERWSHGHSKVLFHLLIPAIYKSILKGETKLLQNKQFLLAFALTAFGIIFRFMLFTFLCLPFIYNSWCNQNNSTYFDHMIFFNVVVIFNFVNVFALFYYCQGKVSFSPLRLIAMETILAIPSLKGHIKGILGLIPKGWRSDKSKKFSNENFLGIYAILLLNIFSLVTIKNLSIGFIFWTLFNIMLIGGGILSFNIYRKPYASKFNVFKQLPFNTWLQLFIISIILNIIFYILEFRTSMNGPKLAMLLILFYSFLLSFRTIILNIILIYKQDKKVFRT